MKLFLTFSMSLSLCLLIVSNSFAQTISNGNVVATLTVANDWGSGYCADVTITNNGSQEITDWRLTISLNGVSINNIWRARVSGTEITPESYNEKIPANQSADFGFCANKTNINSAITFTQLTVYGGGSSSTSSSASSSSSSSSASSSSSSSSTSSSSSGSIPPISGGCDGYATRFWDCCKPHCGWQGNTPIGMDPAKSCSVNNTLLNDANITSSCDGGNAHTCYDFIPYSVNSTLSYGFAATSSGDVCGRCFQLEFTGTSYNAPGDPGSAALLGKTMIVQAINIGFDVGGGQFDLMVPGGGVGAFNACSAQWGVSSQELGAQYGGLLTACKQELGYNASLGEYKSCLTNRCNSVFGSRGLDTLEQGCLWYANWFEAADNPALKYQEVSCPTELSNSSGMDRSFLDDQNQACGN